MLLSFRFANHRSFRDPQQLNLTSVYPSSEAEGVPVAGIFGANASGKSNALHALVFMRQLALRSDREVEPGQGLSRFSFRLDRTVMASPSRYVVDVDLSGVHHSYGFSIDDEGIREEWLHYWPLGRKRVVFERDDQTFQWGEESRRRLQLARVADITSQSALFLSTVARFRTDEGDSDHDPLHDVYVWFQQIQAGSRPGPRSHAGLVSWPESPVDRAVVVGLLRAADIGIVDVRLKALAEDADQPSSDESALSEYEQLRRQLTRPAQPRIRDRLRFIHRGADGEVVLRYGDQSTGTQQLLELANEAAIVLRTGGVMAVDEIDASLHPVLTASLIRIFQDPETNPRRSQLIFTTHDATLLGTFDTDEILKRDQVWFTEKDEEGASTLYPLSDFKPRREGENRQRRYLNGNYGGVPDLSWDLFGQAVLSRQAAS